MSLASLAVVSREDSAQPALPIPMRPSATPAAVALLEQARRGLAEADREVEAAERFIASYLSALRAAAAVLAAHGRPHRGRARPASVWMLLESAAPELREWAAYFAANSATQAAVRAGITSRLSARMADDLFRLSGQFVEVARRAVHGGG